ncbi:Flp family type IVb pilin [bacterium]|nr:Flp family type IVb pilin [bacterium]
MFKFHRNQEGATSVEYAVMLALIAAVCIAAITSVGSATGAFWNHNNQEVSNALSNP